jgi:UDP-3-O-[3-hydroxymyristoyl] glucosamine N-acyltransferase
MDFTVDQIANVLNGELKGPADIKINTLSKIEEAKEGSITFLANPKYEAFIYDTQASAVIVKKDFIPKKEVKACLIKVEDPYTSFTVLLEEYHKQVTQSKSGIENPSYVSKTARTGSDFYLGAFGYLSDNVSIGENVKIFPQTYIGENVEIGDNCIIYAGVKIYAGSKIGNNCVIHSGVVIGSDGFGFAPQEDGTYKTIPQLGQVIIEDNVSIGSNTVIDRATLGATIIKSGVKLDNLIQIAHNVEIGDNTVIVAQAGISGSTKIGKNCVLAGQAGLVGHLEVADRVTIAAQTGLTKSVKEEGSVKLGSPAMDHKDYLRCHAVFRNLPDLASKVKELEEKILNLRAD